MKEGQKLKKVCGHQNGKVIFKNVFRKKNEVILKKIEFKGKLVGAKALYSKHSRFPVDVVQSPKCYTHPYGEEKKEGKKGIVFHSLLLYPRISISLPLFKGNCGESSTPTI